MNLWSWGANSHGQLGLNLCNEEIVKPSKVIYENSDSNFEIRKICCGGGHSLLIDTDGKLFACGWNHKLQLGLDKSILNFQRVWPLSGINFMNITCGWDFSCGVTDDNFLLVWGSNSHGQLGLPKEHFFENVKPTRLQVHACTVSMGLRHTAVVNSKNEVWVTGCGRHGQLGLGRDILISDRFQKVKIIGAISHIACGQNHTVAWSMQENALYVWGDNKHGQLLLDNEKFRKIFEPQKIDIDVRQNVKALLSGWTNILLWLEDGNLLTWGRNSYGQLGSNVAVPGKITKVCLPESRQIQDICLGSEHTLCLATDNSLWAWGWNEHANTGTGLGDAVYTPTRVQLDTDLADQKIISIFAGGGHNFITSRNIETNNN